MSHTILFKVVVVSSNTNSFGLRGTVLVSRSGLAVELGLNDLNVKSVGTVIRVPVVRRDLATRSHVANAVARKLSGEIPRALPKPSVALLREIFPKQ